MILMRIASLLKSRLFGRRTIFSVQIVAFTLLGFVVGCTDEVSDPLDADVNTAAISTKNPAEPPAPTITVEDFSQFAQAGDLAMVQRAIRQGINIDGLNEIGNTALMMAAYEGNAAVVDALLLAGARVDLANSLSRTALMFASTSESPETVELLLKAGADVNAKDSHEAWTPLMFAASEGHVSVVKKLLEYKPNLLLREVDGECALDFAIQRRHTDVVELLQSHMKALQPSGQAKP
jgi:hypothetical protein